MVDIVSLDIRVNTTDVANAKAPVDKLAESMHKLDKAVNPLKPSIAQLNAEAKKIGETGAPAVQKFNDALDKTPAAVNNAVKPTAHFNDEVKKTAPHVDKATRAIGLNVHEMKNLSFQLNDAGTMLASGSSPFQVIATQAGQVYQILAGAGGGVKGAVKDLAARIGGLASVSRIAGGAFVAAAAVGIAAWNSYDNKIKDVQRSLNGLGAGTGLTSTGAFDAARATAAKGNLGFGSALGGVSTFAIAGINKELYQGLNEQAFKMSRGFGMSEGDAQQKLSEAFANPIAGLNELSKTFGPFRVEVAKNITLLQSTNRLEEAQAALYEALDEKLKNVVDTSGMVSRAFQSIKNAGSNVMGKVGAIGQPLTPRDQYRVAWQNEQMATRFGNSEVADQARKKRIAAEAAMTDEELRAERRRTDVLRARQSYLDEENRKIVDLAASSAAAVTARTSTDRLAIEQERLLKEARYDTAKMSTLAAEQSRAYAMAIAEATKAQNDYRRASRDEAFSGGARTELEQFIRRTQLETRDLRERTNVLNVPPPSAIPNDQWRNQVKLGEESRAGNMFNSAPITPFKGGAFGGLPGVVLNPEINGMKELEAALGGTVLKVVPATPAAFATAGPSSNPRQITVGGPNPDKPGAPDTDRIAAYIRNKTEQMFFDQRIAVEANERTLRTNAETFMKSTYEIARENEATRIRNELIKFGITNTEAYGDAIKQAAERQGKLAEAMEKQAESQKKVIDAMDSFRSGAADALSSPLKALARGEKPGVALKQVAQRLGDKSIDMGVGSIIEGLFGKSGKPGGGLFGSLLGGLAGGKSSTGTMDVKAGIVNVNGSSGGLTGGSDSGGLLGSIGKLFGFGGDSGSFGGNVGADSWSTGMGGSGWVAASAKGNVFSHGNIIPFARGGVVGSPTTFPMANGGTGLMGEAGPEAIVPLKKNSDGRLGIAASGGRQGGIQFQVINNTPSKVETRSGTRPDGSVWMKAIVSEVGAAMARGEFDDVNGARYGARPRSVQR